MHIVITRPQEDSWRLMENLIKFLHNTGNLEWGHNDDSTQYFFKINGTTLTKDKTSD